MNILITGGLGHIGSAMISHECMRDYNITVVDNMTTQRYCSLFDMPRPIIFVEKDIANLTEQDLIGIDVVIHLACITNATKSFGNREEVEKVNYTSTIKLMDLCKLSNCKFIFPSSTSVYGVAAEKVYEDDPSFINPQSPYGESKIKGEEYLKGCGLDYLILRLGTIFGSSTGMRFHTAINKFCYQSSIGQPLTVWKENYEQYRPYLGLTDCVSAIKHFLDNDHWGKTFNVLTGNWKLFDIVEMIKSKTEVSLNMVNTPLLNQYSYLVSNDKILETGFSPKDNLEEEIEDTLNRLRNLK
jgi:UDP-glucose 4-epimerase